MAHIRIGNVADFPEARGVAVAVGTRRLAVFRIGTEVYVVDDACPHRNFPLHDGTVSGLNVRCRTHGSCFDLTNGTVTRGPAGRGVRAYPAVIAGDFVELELPD